MKGIVQFTYGMPNQTLLWVCLQIFALAYFDFIREGLTRWEKHKKGGAQDCFDLKNGKPNQFIFLMETDIRQESESKVNICLFVIVSVQFDSNQRMNSCLFFSPCVNVCTVLELRCKRSDEKRQLMQKRSTLNV